jgi:CubicO group peptidase (beta-lactamase class C family)
MTPRALAGALRPFAVALVLLQLAAAAAAQPAAPPDLAGHWEGAIELPGTKLSIDVDFAAAPDGGWTGDISIPAQMAKDLPLGGIAVDSAGEVTFAITGVPGDPTFRGRVGADGALAGSFTQGGGSFAFRLERAETPAARAAGALAGFDEFAEAARAAWEVPGVAMAVVRDGDVVWAHGFGYRDVEGKLPVTTDTLFAIGSSTKAFTTFALGTLVDQGKLDWNEPVRTYLPAFRLHDPAASELITPRDLVTHRSGLPRHDLLWYNNNELSRAQFVARLAHLEPSQQLRAKFQYNNLMYLTAGYLLEQLTGKTWEEAVRERILAPLGMTRSNFSVADSQRSDDFSYPYEERDDVVVKVPFRPIDAVGPAGSINSSVGEMAAWVKLHLSGGKVGDRQLIGKATLADLHSPQMVTGGSIERPELSQVAYGMGWMIDTYRGHQRVHHGGAIDGFSAMVTLLPQDGIGMVVLSNKSGTGLPELLVRHAIDRLLALPPIDWNAEALARRDAGEKAQEEAEAKKQTVRKTGTRPAHQLADYAGAYEHPGYGVLEVAVAGKGLEFTINGITSPLEHWHYEVWNVPEGASDPVFTDSKLLFATDVKGNVASVAGAFEPAVADIVFVKKPDARLSDPEYLKRYAGTYELPGGVAITFELAGDVLTANIPGQPQYHLVPALGGEFTLKEVSIIRLRFEEDAQGKVTGVLLDQPNGIFTAERKE